jgi:hypothetical protein
VFIIAYLRGYVKCHDCGNYVKKSLRPFICQSWGKSHRPASEILSD